MILMKAGLGLLAAGAALIGRSRSERQAIRQALTGRLRSGLGLVLGGVLLIAVGARIQGQIVFRRWKRTHQREIDAVRGQLERLRPVLKPLIQRARQR